MHRSKSPAGRSAAVPKSPRPGLQQRDRSGGGSGGGARGRTEARKDAADASPWDAGYVYRPTVPMHLRGWSPRAASPPAAATPVLRIVSYNILAETLESNTTAGLDPQIASFRARKALLAHELESWNADIYCFQEVTPSTPITPPAAGGRGGRPRGGGGGGGAAGWRPLQPRRRRGSRTRVSRSRRRQRALQAPPPGFCNARCSPPARRRPARPASAARRRAAWRPWRCRRRWRPRMARKTAPRSRSRSLSPLSDR